MNGMNMTTSDDGGAMGGNMGSMSSMDDSGSMSMNMGSSMSMTMNMVRAAVLCKCCAPRQAPRRQRLVLPHTRRPVVHHGPTVHWVPYTRRLQYRALSVMPAFTSLCAPQVMYFQASTRPGPILFKDWEPSTDGQYAGAIFAVACFGLLHQILIFLRATHFRWSMRQAASDEAFPLTLHQAINGALFMLVVAGSYLAMLITMSECRAAPRSGTTAACTHPPTRSRAQHTMWACSFPFAWQRDWASSYSTAP